MKAHHQRTILYPPNSAGYISPLPKDREELSQIPSEPGYIHATDTSQVYSEHNTQTEGPIQKCLMTPMHLSFVIDSRFDTDPFDIIARPKHALLLGREKKGKQTGQNMPEGEKQGEKRTRPIRSEAGVRRHSVVGTASFVRRFQSFSRRTCKDLQSVSRMAHGTRHQARADGAGMFRSLCPISLVFSLTLVDCLDLPLSI